MTRQRGASISGLLLVMALWAGVAKGAPRLVLPLSWTTPSFVDHQPPYADAPGGITALASVACASASQCVAGNPFGDLVTTSDAAGGAGAWHIAHVDNAIAPALGYGIDGLACPSSALCVGVDSAGDLLSSQNPFAGAPVWTITRLEGPARGPALSGLNAVSCPSAELCLAVDHGGSVFSSTDPTGGSGAWRRALVDPRPGLFGVTSISCPSRSLCVAADASGNVLTSTHPGGGSLAWHLAKVDGTSRIEGVSCASVSLCVAVDDTGVLSSTDPSGGPAAWQRGTIDQGYVNRLNAISCPASTLCLAVDQAGSVFSTTDPTGGSSAWTRSSAEYVPLGGPSIPGLTGLTAIACPTTSFCLAVDSLGNAVSSSDPGLGGWTAEQIDGSNVVLAAACPASWCVALDASGNVLTSSAPAAPETWNARAVDPGRPGYASSPGAVSCPTTGFCAAVDGTSRVLTSGDPAAVSSWTATEIDPGHALSSISCPALTLCVAVDDAGNVLSSADPEGSASSWRSVHLDTGLTSTGSPAALEAVSCPSSDLCVAVDSAGNVLTSSSPGGDAEGWSSAAVSGAGLTTVSCPSISFCAAGPTLVTSTSPAGGVAAWTSHAAPSGLDEISCPTADYCIGHDANGNLVTSTDPSHGGSAWRSSHIEPWYIEATTCRGLGWCLAFDGIGDALFGRSVSPAQLLDQPLRRALPPPGHAARIGWLVAHNGYELRFAAPIPGRLALVWRLRGHPNVKLASLAANFAAAGGRRFKLTLTRSGERVLASARQISVIATATFTTPGHRPVTVSRRFSLRR